MNINELFSTDPVTRLLAAERLRDEEKKELISRWGEGLPQFNGAGNAWIMSVGPSPGVGPTGKSARKGGTAYLPVFGEVCPKFESEQWQKMPFARHLLAIVKASFRRAGLLTEAENRCLELFLHMNLDTRPEGRQKNIFQRRLNKGLERFKAVFDLARPRLVVALSKTTYETIVAGVRNGLLGPDVFVGPDRICEKELRCKYGWESCWLKFPDSSSVLLTCILQHPARANLVPRYDEVVGEYLAACVREVSGRNPNQTPAFVPTADAA